MSTRGNNEALDYHTMRGKSNHIPYNLLGDCPSMKDVNNDMNITAIAIVRTALDLMHLEAIDDEYVWNTDWKNSTFVTKCTRLLPSHPDKAIALFQCGVSAFHLCSTRWEFIDANTS